MKKSNPAHIYSEFYDVDIGSEFTTFKYPIKSRTVKKFKVNTREFSPIRYMWKTSIPENWFKLADPSRFYNMRVEKQKNKNTLQFLEETQKYIYNIRKPLAQKVHRKKDKLKIETEERNVKTAVGPQRVYSDRRLVSTAQASRSSLNKDLMPRVTSYESLKSTPHMF